MTGWGSGVVPDTTGDRTNGQHGPPLDDAEARALAVFDAVVDGIVTIDAHGVVQSMNPAAVRIFGYETAEVIGQNVSMLMPEPYRSEHDGYLDHYFQTGEERIIGTGRTVEGRRKDASVFPLELSVTASTLPSGERMFIGLVRDVTQRVWAENALRDAEARLSAIVETAVDGIIVMDAATLLIESFNPAAERMFGYTATEMIGQSARLILAPELIAEYEEFRDSGPGLSNIYRGALNETEGVRRDGTRFPMDLAGSSAMVGGRLICIAVVRDVTERRRSEAALREAQKMESLGLLAGGIAHDFNNLLVGILGNAGLALEELSPESPARPIIEDIELAGRRAAEVAHQMLAYSGKGTLALSPVHLNQIVEEMTHLLRVSVGKGVVLRQNLAPGLPRVEADPTQLRQVIMNLVINGSDAIGDRSGVVTLTTGLMHADRSYLDEAYLDAVEEGDFVFLEVSDTGQGMEPDVRARVFDPFFTTKFTGRGLGLAVVLGVVRGHRGAIKVYSEPGHGTTFRVLIPAMGADLVHASTSRSSQRPPAIISSKMVLVVDDDSMVRAVTTRLLQNWGLGVLTADDGLQGVETFRQHQQEVGLVLLDLTMPGMDGEQAFREMRAIDPHAPIILMSGYNEAEATRHFAGRGITGFVQKPYQVDLLRSLVREVMEAHPEE